MSRRHRARRREGGLGEAVGRRGERQLDARGALETLEGVRVACRSASARTSADRAHGGGGDVARAALLEDLLAGALLEPGGELRVDLVGVAVVHVEAAAEAPLGRPFGRADHLDEQLVLVALGGLDRDPAVGAAEELVRVGLAEHATPLAAAQPVREEVAHHRRARVHRRPDIALGDVDDARALDVRAGVALVGIALVRGAQCGDGGDEAGLDRGL